MAPGGLQGLLGSSGSGLGQQLVGQREAAMGNYRSSIFTGDFFLASQGRLMRGNGELVKPKPKDIREELQADTDEWLKGI